MMTLNTAEMLFVSACGVCVFQPPMPSLPEDESDEEKGLRRLFEKIAGSVRTIKIMCPVHPRF